MVLVPDPIKDDWVRVRQIIQKLSTKLSPTSEPTFAGLTMTGLTASRLAATDADKKLASVSNLASWVAGVANEINIANDGDGTITIGIVDPLIVGKGGIGVATLTDHGILLGSGTGAITPLGAAANGQLPIGSTGADPVLAALTGTANQINVTNAAGSITLSIPQNIHAGAIPSFAGTILTGLTGTRLVATGDDKELKSVSELSAWVTGTTNRISVIDDGAGKIVLSAPQDIHTGASPTFAGLTTSTITTGTLTADTLITDTLAVMSGEFHLFDITAYLQDGVLVRSIESGYASTFDIMTADADSTDDVGFQVRAKNDTVAVNYEWLFLGWDASDAEFQIKELSFGESPTARAIRIFNASDAQILLETDGIVHVPSAEFAVGEDDTTKGNIALYGDGAGSEYGGRVTLYTAADYDSTIDYYRLRTRQNKLQIGPDTNANILELTANSLKITGLGIFQSNIAANDYMTMMLGADRNADTLTDNTRKYCRLGMPHYDIDTLPTALIIGDSASAYSELRIGGGNAAMNAMTKISFYTAATTKVTTGTERMRIDSAGNIDIFSGDLRIGTATDMLAPLNITGDTASIEDRHEGMWIRGRTGAYIVQINVRGSRLEIGGGGSLDTTPAMSVNYMTGNVGIAGSISSATATITASADDTDVSEINVLFINPAAATSIGAFVGGVEGQVLRVVIVDDDQDVTLQHNKGTGNQNIFIHAGADEILDSHYGGWVLICDGSNWYGTAHERHS